MAIADAMQAQNTVERAPKKHHRKRPNKKGGPSGSQPAPKTIQISQDRIPSRWRTCHVAGEPMISPEMLQALTGYSKDLHELVLSTEQRLLASKEKTYPVFTAKVPEGLAFVDKSPGDLLFVRFDELFDMYHMRWLYPSLVRLFAVYQAYMITKE
jgi:hypothetical protein